MAAYDIDIYQEYRHDFVKIAKIDRFVDLDLHLEANEVSSYTLTVQASENYVEYLILGNCLEIKRDGISLIAGPIRRIENQDDKFLKITGYDPIVYLKDRLTLNTPFAGGSTTSYDDYVFPAPSDPLLNGGEVLATLVKNNLDVPESTRNNPLFFDINPSLFSNVGKPTRITCRLENLLDVCKRIASDSFVFDVKKTLINESWGYELSCHDWSDTQHVISRQRGNLLNYNYLQEYPSANFAYVQGATETGPIVTTVTNEVTAGKFGYLEGFVSSDLGDTQQLQDEGNRYLSENGEGFLISAETVETESSKIGRDYNVGDIVTVIVGNIPYALNVYAADFSYNFASRAEQVRAKVGNVGNKKSPITSQDLPEYLFSLFRRLDQRMSKIERK